MSVSDLFARSGPFFKPPRGTYKLDIERKRAAARAEEDENKHDAKVRDQSRCRWPGKHQCRGIVEAAHIFLDKGMGGDHLTRSGTWNLMGMCSWIHRAGPRSIHSKDLWVDALTEAGADGPCIFWARDDSDRPYIVAQETAPFVYTARD